MCDRELLELAAKAAGYTSHGYGEMVGDSPCLLLKEADFTGLWAPLTDDGDALRLAVKLRLLVNVTEFFSHATDGSELDGEELHNGDPYAATRRAIVRAAAEIGRASGEASNG